MKNPSGTSSPPPQTFPNPYRRRRLAVIACLLFGVGFGLHAQTLPGVESSQVRLPNGWSITPVGTSLPLGDLPLNIAVSRRGDLLAVTNNGQSDQTIQLIDPIGKQVLDSVLVGKAWLGLAFSADGRSLYASGGNDNWILSFDVSGRRLVPKDTVRLGDPWPERISPAGIALDDEAGLLYTVTKENSSLYVVDLKKKEVADRYPLGAEGYACLLSPDRKTLFISCWGCDRVELFSTADRRMAGSIAVGDNPNDLCLSADGRYLYVANANDNSVSVIDVNERRVLETLNAALFPGAPAGSTTNSVALNGDGNTLFVANADNNCLAVFDVSHPGNSTSKGFIPTGWYPTCVRVVGGDICVANGKGFSSFPNPMGPNPTIKRDTSAGAANPPLQYIAGLLRGTLSIIPVPGAEMLAEYSRAVYRNTPYSKEVESLAAGSQGNPIPRRSGDPSPIRYVFYILKENRTYDQVLSDVPGGNGDTSLLLFGAKVTPNQHALAKEFVLLDNFYVDGEVSADGHNWSMGAYATDFLEKNWPTSYGDRGGDYNAEGTREIANNKGGFIWDNCARHGVTYRTYGEFADDYKPNLPVLEGHFCPYFTSWDQSVTDTARVGQWKRDFDSLLAAGEVPQLSTIRLINDHTEGLRKGRPTPFAHVADNDLAVGLFVEHLSRSPIWGETAIFIVEDDAQNGPDHVDAHRTTAYLAGGYVKRRFIDHTMYSTSSLLRTIELILGLPPMSQYDAAATPMWRCFSDTANTAPFLSLPAKVNLGDRNLASNRWQRMSEEFNFAIEDRAPDAEFNEVIWVAVKGEEIPCPPSVRAAFIKLPEDDD